jgi:hypothetical protein
MRTVVARFRGDTQHNPSFFRIDESKQVLARFFHRRDIAKRADREIAPARGDVMRRSVPLDARGASRQPVFTARSMAGKCQGTGFRPALTSSGAGRKPVQDFRRRHLVLLLSASLVIAGCHSTGIVKRHQLEKSLARGGQSGALSMAGERVDPNTRIRFYSTTGLRTRWIEARTMQVNDKGVSFAGGKHFIRWSEVDHAEVKNLSGARVLAGTVAVAAVVAVVVALIASKGKGGGGPRLGGLGGSSKRGGIRVRRALWIPRPRPPGVLATRVIVGAALAHRDSVAPPPPPPPPGAMQDPGAIQSPAAPVQPPQANDGEQPTPAPLVGKKVANVTLPDRLASFRPRPTPLRSLFTAGAKRRSNIRFLTSLESGVDFMDGGAVISGLNVGLRFYDIFEIGGGLRHAHYSSGLGTTGADHRNAYFGVGRIGINADLDSRRYVSIPFQAELGGGDGIRFRARVVFGVRVRFWKGMFAALYPFNPTYSVFAAGTPGSDNTGWRFPTTLELGYTF